MLKFRYSLDLSFLFNSTFSLIQSSLQFSVVSPYFSHFSDFLTFLTRSLVLGKLSPPIDLVETLGIKFPLKKKKKKLNHVSGKFLVESCVSPPSAFSCFFSFTYFLNLFKGFSWKHPSKLKLDYLFFKISYRINSLINLLYKKNKVIN